MIIHKFNQVQIVLQVLLLTLCLFTSGAQSQITGTFTGVEPTGPLPETIPVSTLGRAAIGLKTQMVEKRPLPLKIETTGKVEAIPLKEFVQHAPLSGRITDVKVELGDKVDAGEVLAIIDSPEINQLAAETLQTKAGLESEIMQQKVLLSADVDQARVQLNLAELAHNRNKKLYEEGILANKALQESQAQLKLAESKLKAAADKKDISLSALRTKFKVIFDSLSHRMQQLGVPDIAVRQMLIKQHTILQVPVNSARSGVITDLQAFAGQGIDPRVPLFKVSDLSEVWVAADIYEDDMARMREGQPVSVTIAALPNQTFTGHLAYIGRQVNPDTRTLLVRVEIANPQILLKPGMFATVSIQTSEPTPTMILPREAVVDSGGHHLVFLETKGGYQPCRVKVGRSMGDDIEIVEGLAGGQRVVVQGAFQLAAELLKSHGGSSLFSQATEGERQPIEPPVNQSNKAKASGFQAMFVFVILAFLLGFGISYMLQHVGGSANKSSSTGSASKADNVKSTN